ncbi:major facilitator superfamily domain-containing protein [Trametes elegans]|nr:major facilitator superfamily domain-containing protein [Trametes elegans]
MTAYTPVNLSSDGSSTATATTDESDPLLHAPEPRKPQPNPLPVAQIAVIYTVKLTLPVANNQSIPYYHVLIERLAASEGAETGYYSGLAHSAFSVAKFISMFFWGRVSDSKGRVPVVLLGISETALSTVLFGLSTTFSGVLIKAPKYDPDGVLSSSRYIWSLAAGFFFGITGAIHSVVGELSDETNQSTAFRLYDIISALGFVIGSPAKEWADVFTYPVWTTYPYLLPCLISSAVAVVAAVLARFALEETLPSKRTCKTPLVEEEPPHIDTVVDLPLTLADLQPLGVRAMLALPVLRAVFFASGALGFAGSCFTNVFVLMAYTPLRQGSLALSAALSIALKLCMPKFLRRFGALSMFDFAMLAWVATFAAMPLASLDHHDPHAGPHPGLRLAPPRSASLGTASGLAELAQSLAGAGHLWVVFMLLESGFGCLVAWRIRRYRY